VVLARKLSALQDGTGSDSQGFDVFTLTGTTLYASLDNDGEATKTVDLSSLQDGSGAFATSSGVTTNSPGSYQYDDFVFRFTKLCLTMVMRFMHHV
jgi:hypothetical protein